VAHPPVKRRLTLGRLAGLDRSGPLPPATVRGQPLRPFTLPNLIGFVRLGLLPVFLAMAFSTPDGRDLGAALLFAGIAASDYLDGIVARLTGQYSRLGALMDPLVDRLLVLSGLGVSWHFELLPRWALAVLAVRELAMLALAQWALRHGLELRINWVGRWGVWPAMAAPFLAMAGADTAARICLYVGLTLALAATVLYVHAGTRVLEERRRAAPSSQG
jgi:CDP-diacylglycerol--glycerol-3-phosphate 3-phosphatidyltransferase